MTTREELIQELMHPMFHDGTRLSRQHAGELTDMILERERSIIKSEQYWHDLCLINQQKAMEALRKLEELKADHQDRCQRLVDGIEAEHLKVLVELKTLLTSPLSFAGKVPFGEMNCSRALNIITAELGKMKGE